MRRSVVAPRPGRLAPWVRRAADLVVVLVAAPGALLLLSIVAVAVKLDSSGPLFITHPRVGRGGRIFPLVKVRTMVKDAEQQKEALRHLNVLPWPDFKIPNDPRVTRVGRWLRQSSLDELPQLWNLLRGDMTLIGPRPCSIAVSKYRLWQTERLEVTPGLVGRWQAQGRNHVDFEARCRMDISQVRSSSAATSAALLASTARAVLTTRESY